MNTLVVYFSRTGNNKYLAEKIAQTLAGDIEAIVPRVNLFPVLLLFSATKISLGVKMLTHQVHDYDAVIVCGPVWMGHLISPLRDMIKKYGTRIKSLYFATCCGSSDRAKDDKFGYAHVFRQVHKLAGDRCVHCEAFPIGLVLPENKQDDSDAMMKARLSDQHFIGHIQRRFEHFIQKVTESCM
jgi:menaquinone-dependent protoporphyrinogen IX oxidase